MHDVPRCRPRSTQDAVSRQDVAAGNVRHVGAGAENELATSSADRRQRDATDAEFEQPSANSIQRLNA